MEQVIVEPRPTYIREYRVTHMTKKGPVEYIKRVRLPVPKTGPKHVGRPKVVIPDVTIERVKQLRADRYTFKQIQEMTNISLTTLAKIAKI